MEEKNEKEAKRRTRSLAGLHNYQAVFGSPAGKKVLWDLMKKSRFLVSTFDSCPYKMAFNEGARAAVVEILGKCNVDVKRLENMMKEEQGRDDDEIIV